MKNFKEWFLSLSSKQKIWLWETILLMILIIIMGMLFSPKSFTSHHNSFSISQNIGKIAPSLGVTRKSLARELGLSLDISKKDSLQKLGISQEKLKHTIHHLRSHEDSILKYYIYFLLVLGGFIFMFRLGRPDNYDNTKRSIWYPRVIHIAFLGVSVTITGFLLGKSPNPMEGIVKVFKSMVGLYPDPLFKILAFLFFLILAIIGNKLICGWACPFGALQELIYYIPVLRKFRYKKLPFIFTNTIRTGLFILMLMMLFGIFGSKGFVLYHNLNPFNLFNFDIESFNMGIKIGIILIISFIIYRPFCQIICPFGFISWVAEKMSLYRINIDKNKCINCGACSKVCPTDATKDIISNKIFSADCFSCGRCLNICPVDAIKYKPVSKQINLK